MIQAIQEITNARAEGKADSNPSRADNTTVPVGTGHVRIDADEVEQVPSADQDTEMEPIHLDQVFGILQNERRRSVLRYMRTVDDEVRLGELAEQIAAWECDKDVAQITSGERKRVYVGLYQSHLPKMDDVSVIEYNKPRGKIRPGKNMAILQYYLPSEDDNAEFHWTRYHWAISITAVVLVALFVLVAFLA